MTDEPFDSLGSNHEEEEEEHPLQEIVTEIETLHASHKVPSQEGLSFPSEKHIFQPGDLVAGRYQVIRYIAAGGMGEVYEVEDFELKERIAMKVILPKFTRHEEAMARFRREIHIARKITHQNVCRIYDIGHHYPEPGKGKRITFLTMELLEGSSLEQYIRKHGPLSKGLAVDILTQLCQGLAAAHHQGIIHRDFKSANVMLLEEKGRLRAVITDFGLAKQILQTEEEGITKTAEGFVLGTPAYMAPEQLEGGSLTPATDIYALGVVFFQMVTGHLPFTGDTPLTTAIKRLKEPPPSPKVYVPDLDASLEEVILRCLDREPKNRFSDALEVARALKAPEFARTTAIRPPIPKKRPIFPWLIALFLLLSVIGWFGYHTLQEQHFKSFAKEAQSHMRPGLAIFPIVNQSEDPTLDWIGEALPAILKKELALGEGLRLVKTEAMGSFSPNPENIKKIHTTLGAKFAIWGFYGKEDDIHAPRMWVKLQIWDMEAEKPIKEINKIFNQDGLIQAFPSIGKQIRHALGQESLKAQDLQAAWRVGLSDSRSVKSYAQGLQAVKNLDYLTASEAFREALRIEPKNPYLLMAYSDALMELGYREEAYQQAEKTLASLPQLPREDELWMKARIYELSNQWQEAEKTYWKLLTFYPDNIDYALRLIKLYTQIGKTASAMKIVLELKNMPPPLNQDPRILLEEAAIHGLLTHYDTQIAVAKKAWEAGKTIQSEDIQARAALMMAQGYQMLGELKKAEGFLKEAKGIYEKQGKKYSVAGCLLDLAQIIKIKGDLTTATKLTEEALGLFREQKNPVGESRALNFLAGIRMAEGNLTEAKGMYQEALALFQKLADKNGLAGTYNNLGILFQKENAIKEAEKAFRQAADLYKKTGKVDQLVYVYANLSSLLMGKGAPQQAEILLEEAAKLAKKTKNKKAYGAALTSLGHFHLRTKQIKKGEKEFQKALRLAQKIDDLDGQARAHEGLALSAYLQGELEEAQVLYTQALKAYQKMHKRASTVRLLLRLGDILMEKGELLQAQASLEEALAIQKELGNQKGMVVLLHRLGKLFVYQGDVKQGNQVFNQARQIAETIDDNGGMVTAIAGLVEIEIMKGQWDQARKLWEFIKSKGIPRIPPVIYVSTAWLNWYQGEDQEAFQLCDEAIQQCRTPQERLQCLFAKAWLYYEAGRILDAKKLLEKEGKNFAGLMDVESRWRWKILQVALFGEANIHETLNRWENINDRLRKMGLQRLYFQSQIHLGRLELNQDLVQKGTTRLERVKEEAKELGLALYGQQAKEILAYYQEPENEED